MCTILGRVVDVMLVAAWIFSMLMLSQFAYAAISIGSVTDRTAALGLLAICFVLLATPPCQYFTKRAWRARRNCRECGTSHESRADRSARIDRLRNRDAEERLRAEKETL